MAHTDAHEHTSRLEQWKVIPDVIDSFQPSVKAKIIYGGTPLLSGIALRIEGTQEHPEIVWESSDKDALYTFVMVDPDAPSPKEPSAGEFVHWILTNVPGSYSSTCDKLMKVSTETLPYTGPAPPEGNHRYVFVVYKQGGKVDLKAPSGRKNFSVRSFAKENSLGSPVYSDVFFSEKVDGAY